MKMTVPTLSGPEEVRGRKYGPFLVHRSVSTDPGFWTVTHVGCGLAFPFGFETSANAVAFAKEVEEVWTGIRLKWHRSSILLLAKERMSVAHRQPNRPLRCTTWLASTGPRVSSMCNLYSMTKSQAAIRAIVRAIRDQTGNLPPLPGIFPDYPAPIVRNAPDGVRELVMARWGMPAPTSFGGPPITNIRNVKSPHWRRWLRACAGAS